MVFLLTIIFSVLFFQQFKIRWNLTERKALTWLGLSGLMLMVIYFANIRLNWEYFKGYTGPLDARYNFVYSVAYLSGYGMLSVFIILMCSGIYGLRKNRP